ncbi:MAG: GNAT family N-acetyltransferase [Anaerolineae bacterium]
MPELYIRPERVTDYPRIEDLHIRAFGNRFDEAALVALLRTRSAYDNRLALVAEKEGLLVGHVLFNPMSLYWQGETLQAVNLAPIAVHPDFQGSGIGGQLIIVGHTIARDKGYDFAFLLGHTDYYPRFGYRTGAYGDSALTVRVADVPAQSEALTTASLMPADLMTLAALHHANEKQVSLSPQIAPELALWLSPHPGIPATVYRQQGQIIGYTRGAADNLRHFLAVDDASAQAIVHHIADERETLTLPLHPQSARADAFSTPATVEAWGAAMICPLQTPAVIDRYLQALATDGTVGRVLWPSVFDIAG